jgi:abortive infection bacteriophage resistance protein
MPDLLEEYKKPPKTIDEQIDLLISRGLIVEDKEDLRYYLKNISYYHLSIYFKYFQKDDQFYEGIKFGDVLRMYRFDNKLRFLLLESLERIEKSFKCRMAYELSLENNDSHWHLDENLFIDKKSHEEALSIITEEVDKSREISILHYKQKYDKPALPPIWTSLEILSFGQCVKICKSLKREYRNKISRTFGDDERFIMNWMHCLSVLRNNCAHHSHLWNRDLVFTPQMNHKIYGEYFNLETRRIYNYLVVLQIMLSKINPTTSWLDSFKEYQAEYKVGTKNMGFPDDWEDRLNKIMAMELKKVN